MGESVGTVFAAIVGVLVGAGVVFLLHFLWRRPAQDLARQLFEQAQADKLNDLQSVIHQVQAAFAQLSRDALTASNEQFLQLAATRLATQSKEGEAALESKKKLIDETVRQIAVKLTEVGTSLQTLEKDRRQAHGTLLQQLEHTTKATTALQDTAGKLREALANPQRRGQWGERMAEDVLRLAGFIEGVNYRKQAATAVGNRPDFTFLLPQNQCVHMDVKFPLPNYLKYLDASDDAGRDQSRKAFLADVRARIREVTTREYIDPEGGTVDYVLVFIPNEQVYSFIHEHDPALLDEALRQKVVLCSPLTLYAVLALIRHTAERFRVEETSHEILALLGAFTREWHKYTELMDKLGKALEDAVKHYESLTTTRARQLERQLDKIEELRTQGRSAPPAGAREPAETP